MESMERASFSIERFERSTRLIKQVKATSEEHSFNKTSERREK
jgi:hypothetical protein